MVAQSKKPFREHKIHIEFVAQIISTICEPKKKIEFIFQFICSSRWFLKRLFSLIRIHECFVRFMSYILRWHTASFNFWTKKNLSINTYVPFCPVLQWKMQKRKWMEMTHKYCMNEYMISWNSCKKIAISKLS